MPLKLDKQTFTVITTDDISFLSQDESFSISYPFRPSVYESTEEYDIHLFKNRYGSSERHIFQICHQNICFGWIFPLIIFDDPDGFIQNILEITGFNGLEDQTIQNSLKLEENKTKKFFYEKVAYPAFRKLVEDSLIHKPAEVGKTEYKILDFYDEETVVLIVSKTKLEKLSPLKIEDFIPDFFKWGYVLIHKEDDFYIIEVNQQNPHSILDEKKTFEKIKVEPLSKMLRNEVYITELFKNVLKVKLHPLVRFHLLYQVIELLINQIGIQQFNDNVAALTDLQNIKPSDLRSVHEIKDLLERIRKLDVPNEQERINKLIDEKCKLKKVDYQGFYKHDLIDDNNTELPKQIYKLRNLLVHGYYSLFSKDKDIDKKIDLINRELEKLIVDIVINYPSDS